MNRRRLFQSLGLFALAPLALKLAPKQPEIAGVFKGVFSNGTYYRSFAGGLAGVPATAAIKGFITEWSVENGQPGSLISLSVEL